MNQGQTGGPRRQTAARPAAMGERYLRQARADMAAGKAMVVHGTFFAAAHFSHEAAEKALKAACWHLRAEEPPWSHDLAALAELAGEKPELIPVAVQTATDLLDAMFERVRYPSGDMSVPIPADLIGEADGLAALAASEEVLTWVDQLLRQPPGRARRERRS